MFCNEHGTIDYCPECLAEDKEQRDHFGIDDLVEIKGDIAPVVGVIHAEERIFVDLGEGEKEFKFSDVGSHWIMVKA
tara:strand:+ start:6273 stop:6503 length:231 start_codon:yes stop_codon:yes gene_type:complete